MWTRQRKARIWGHLVLPAIAAAFLAYFNHHTEHGSFGLTAKDELLLERAQLEAQLEQTQNRRKKLEHRVALLQDGTLEKDMLDEQVRKSLGMHGKNEVVILRTTR